MKLNFLFVWGAVVVTVIIAASIVRKNRKQNSLSETEIVVAGFAIGSMISLVKVIIKVVSTEKLQADLDLDGAISLCLGCGLGIYLSLKEVIKLFV
jgi:ABC-type Fe3+-siderophore transport system permease subunit